MSELEIIFKSRLESGRGRVDKISHYMGGGCKRAVLLSDPSLGRNKVLGVSEMLERKNIECVVFSEISEKATSRDLEGIMKVIFSSYADSLIAMGGIKTLNLARLAVCSADSGRDPDDILDKSHDKPPRGNIFYVEVPASLRYPLMFSPYTLITDGRNRTPVTADTGMFPSLIVKDPEMCETLPQKNRDSIYFEVLLHAAEVLSYNKRSFFTDSLAESAVEKLLFYKGEFTADILSDIALSVDFAYSVNGPGVWFYISSAINTFSGVPKSYVSTVLLPHFLEYCFKKKSGAGDFFVKIIKRQAAASDAYSREADEDDVLMLIRKKIKMRGLPLRLSELGIKKDVLNKVTALSPENLASEEGVSLLTGRDLPEILGNAY